MAQKMIRIMIVPPSSGPKGKLSTGSTTIAPGSGEMSAATLSGLEATAVGPLAPEAAGLGWPAALGEGLGPGAEGAGLGTATGLPAAVGAGLVSTATGDGDAGRTEGIGAGTKASEVPAPSMCAWIAPAATTPPMAKTAKIAGKRKRRVSLGRIRGHFSGITAAHGSLPAGLRGGSTRC
jgi:hypothetical protein